MIRLRLAIPCAMTAIAATLAGASPTSTNLATSKHPISNRQPRSTGNHRISLRRTRRPCSHRPFPTKRGDCRQALSRWRSKSRSCNRHHRRQRQGTALINCPITKPLPPVRGTPCCMTMRLMIPKRSRFRFRPSPCLRPPTPITPKATGKATSKLLPRATLRTAAKRVHAILDTTTTATTERSVAEAKCSAGGSLAEATIAGSGSSACTACT